MSKITPQEKLDLKKMLSNSDAPDNTEYIRRVKHSVKIRNDIRAIDKIKRTPDISPENIKDLAKEAAPFLLENYADLFKKVVEDELDLEIMSRLLTVLKLIEDDKVDQHEASVMVGKILKELYVDSALKKCKKMDEAADAAAAASEPEEPKITGKPISWQQWRTMRAKIITDLAACGIQAK